VAVSLDGYAGPQNVGILMAQEHGFFADVGLDVWVGMPRSANVPVQYATDGTDDLAVAQLPQVAMMRDKGTRAVAVGSLIPQPTAAMIWLQRSKLRSIADLEGKTIAIPGALFQEALLESVLSEADLTLADVEVKKVGPRLVSVLISGDADAIFGGSQYIEGVELELRGAEPVITPVQSLGIPAYDETVVVADADLVAEEPGFVRAFMSAVARGSVAAMEHPEAAVDAVEQAGEQDPDVGRNTTAAQIEANLPLLSRTGYMDPERAEDLLAWMNDEGLIEEELPPSEVLTNDYLAAQPEGSE